MVIQNVTIKNFKGIEEKTIELKPGFNLIKGVNGKGKTSILEAISVGLGGFIAGLSDVNTRHFSADEICTVYTTVGDGSVSKKHFVPVEVSMNVDLYGEQIAWTRSRNSIKASRSTIQPRDICRMAEKMAEDDNTELPILAYLGAGRVWAQKREKSENVFRKQYFRTVGYTDTLVEASNIKLLLNWCARMEQISWQKEMKIAEYEAVKKTVANFMDHMEKSSGHEVLYDKQNEEVLYRKDNSVQPVMQLSAGYQSLIWMVFDIAYRMAVLNPAKKDKIAETCGVVLIDEIDMHLHPKWQWNIINALRTVFPNVQFVAATHSPILFASAKEVWLIDVDDEETNYSVSHYGIDVNTSMDVFQDTKQVTEEVQKKIDAFYNAMDEEKYDEAKIILEDIENTTAPTHPLLIELRTRYDFETESWED